MKLINVAYGANIIEVNGKVFLFDVGIKGYARDNVLPYLRVHYPHLEDIEAIFISHYHYNHIEGVPTIIDNYNVKHVYTNGTYSDDPNEPYVNLDSDATENMEQAIESNNIPYTFYKEGDIVSGENVTFTFLSPLEKYRTDGGSTTDPNGETSGVMRVDYGNFSAIFGGDLDRGNILKEIWQKTELADTNVYFWPHHGAERVLDSNNAIDDMNLDLAIVERIRTAGGTIEYLEENNIDYLYMIYHPIQAIEAHMDGSFVTLTPTKEEYLTPKGKTFIV